MSLKTDFAAELVARRRRLILEVLGHVAAYTLNEVEINEQLAAHGYPAATADLRDDLRHLRDRDCLRVDTPGGVWLATLTRTGDEAAKGRVEVDGVARPGPGA